MNNEQKEQMIKMKFCDERILLKELGIDIVNHSIQQILTLLKI